MNIKRLIKTEYDIDVKGISYNSQNTKTGDVFVAIRGFKTDGHAYIKNAVEAGAVCVVCEEKCDDVDVPQIVVENSRKTLGTMSRIFYNYPDKRIKLIGVTGTNGKTTVTYLVKSILEQAGYEVGLIGTNQNMIKDRVIPTERTTPEALELAELFSEMADNGCDYAIMEVSSHSLELDRVTAFTFEYGMFTNLTQDHLDFHGTMTEYLKAKTKLFGLCEHGIINADDEGGQLILKTELCPFTTYGIKSGDVKAENIKMGINGVDFTVGERNIFLGIPGKFSVYNALAAIALTKKIGIPERMIESALRRAEGVKGRMEIIPTGKNFTVIIDYAHTPDGMDNLLKAVKGFATGRVVVLFGCGGDRDRTKRPLMGKIAGKWADLCIVTSDNPRTEEPSAIIRDILPGVKETEAEYVVVENRRDAIEFALSKARENDIIVLAGKGHETYQIFADKTIDFDERKIVGEILEGLN